MSCEEGKQPGATQARKPPGQDFFGILNVIHMNLYSFHSWLIYVPTNSMEYRPWATHCADLSSIVFGRIQCWPPAAPSRRPKQSNYVEAFKVHLECFHATVYCDLWRQSAHCCFICPCLTYVLFCPRGMGAGGRPNRNGPPSPSLLGLASSSRAGHRIGEKRGYIYIYVYCYLY